MKRNSLLQRIVFLLILAMFAYGCSAPTSTIVKEESLFEKPRSFPLLFDVLEVEVTKKAQHFVERFDLENFKPVIGEYAPSIGYSFVIVSYRIKNPSAIEARFNRSEFILIDNSGSSAPMMYGTSFDSSPSKPIWGYYTDRTLPPNFQEEDKELFIVEDDFIQGSKVLFHDKQYPLQLSTLSM